MENHSPAYAKFFGEGEGTVWPFAFALISSAYLAHLIFGKFVGPVVCALTVATFLNHIVHVVLIGPSREVPRIAAVRVVAAMENHKSFWDRTIHKFISNAMGNCRFSTHMRLPVVSTRIFRIFRPPPFPAFKFRNTNIDFRPEEGRTHWVCNGILHISDYSYIWDDACKGEVIN